MHQRIWPHSEEVMQYATDRGPDLKPWIVRDRQSALRNERQGRGRAVARVWIPTSWELINPDYEDEEIEGEQ